MLLLRGLDDRNIVGKQICYLPKHHYTVGSQADMGKFWPTPTIIAARFGIIAAMTP